MNIQAYWDRDLLDRHQLPMIGPRGVPLTLREAACIALDRACPGDQQLGNKAKYDLGRIGDDIQQNMPLRKIDLETVRERIGLFFEPGVMRPAWKLLDEPFPETES
ncbi:hypothetical protein sos41_11970 [Alphaproteobacteria bacterium SO-S41]|nr:hypothetical protein sos41_11970 [Alphaproteobacteria bacterium SO-S41]